MRLTLALTWLSMLAASMCAALASAATCSAERLADDHAGRGGEGFMVHTAPDSAALASSESLELWEVAESAAGEAGADLVSFFLEATGAALLAAGCSSSLLSAGRACSAVRVR